MLIIGVINVIFEQTDDVFDEAEAWRSGIGQICIAGVGLIGGVVARCCEGRVALLLALVCSCAAFAGYGTRLALLKPPPPSRFACPPPHTHAACPRRTPPHTPRLCYHWHRAPALPPPQASGPPSPSFGPSTTSMTSNGAPVRSLTDQSSAPLSLTLAVCL